MSYKVGVLQNIAKRGKLITFIDYKRLQLFSMVANVYNFPDFLLMSLLLSLMYAMDGIDGSILCM